MDLKNKLELEWTLLIILLIVLRRVIADDSCSHIKYLSQGDDYLEVVDSAKVNGDGVPEVSILWKTDYIPGDVVKIKVDGDLVLTKPADDSGYLKTSLLKLRNHTYEAEYLRADNSKVRDWKDVEMSGWMWCLRDSLSLLTLGETFFPGTHNSGSYMTSTKTSKLSIADRFNKYIYNQDLSIEDQLKKGARYLDIRVGYYPREDSDDTGPVWYLNHDFIRVRPLYTVLRQINRFMGSSNEIVILDFHAFPQGFKSNTNIHGKLAEFLKQELGNHMHLVDRSKPWEMKLQEVWESGRRLIVSYNKRDLARSYHFFPPIQQLWADKQYPSELYYYLEEKLPWNWKTEDRMTAAMAQLTPSTLGVLTDLHGGLRRLAERVNTEVSLKLIDDTAWGSRIQAVAVDFLSSTNVVQAAIRNNVKRSLEKS